MTYKPMNKLISDVYYRLLANLPLTDSRHRENLKKEWKILEGYIKKYYNYEVAFKTNKEYQKELQAARIKGYQQAQDDYNIVTERDPAYKKLNKIFDKKKKAKK